MKAEDRSETTELDMSELMGVETKAGLLIMEYTVLKKLEEMKGEKFYIIDRESDPNGFFEVYTNAFFLYDSSAILLERFYKESATRDNEVTITVPTKEYAEIIKEVAEINDKLVTSVYGLKADEMERVRNEDYEGLDEIKKLVDRDKALHKKVDSMSEEERLENADVTIRIRRDPIGIVPDKVLAEFDEIDLEQVTDLSRLYSGLLTQHMITILGIRNFDNLLVEFKEIETEDYVDIIAIIKKER